MSKIIQKPLIVPSNVDLKIVDNGESYTINVKGPKGKVDQVIPYKWVKITREGDEVKLELTTNDTKKKSFVGTTYRLIRNTIVGVSNGFSKVLELSGVGFKAQVKGNKINLNLGYSHDINFEIPKGINIEAKGTRITVSGTDKNLVGLTAAQLRELRMPDPYKGKGVRYEGENPVRKVGKKAAK